MQHLHTNIICCYCDPCFVLRVTHFWWFDKAWCPYFTGRRAQNGWPSTKSWRTWLSPGHQGEYMLSYAWVHAVLHMSTCCLMHEYMYAVLHMSTCCLMPEYMLSYTWVHAVLCLSTCCLTHEYMLSYAFAEREQWDWCLAWLTLSLKTTNRDAKF